jgi:bacterioferritin
MALKANPVAGVKGDPKVVDVLNRALRHEMTAVNQYWLHYRLLANWGFARLAAKEREESIEEMRHADRIVDRIIFLGGHPNMQQLDPLMIGQSLEEVLRSDLKGEHSARTLYIEGRRTCDEAGDFVSMRLFDELLADEEGHIDFLDTQLELLRRIGTESYGQLQAKPADAAEEKS